MDFAFKPIQISSPLLKIEGGFSLEETRSHFVRLTVSNNNQVQNIGKSSRFEQRVIYFEAHQTTVINAVHDNLDIRVVAHLWLVNKCFLNTCPVSSALLDKFTEIRSQQGLLVTFDLIKVFFKHFKECGDRKSLGIFLQNNLKRRKFWQTDIRQVQKLAHILFQYDSYKAVVALAKKNNSLDAVLQKSGLSQHYQGNYTELCYRTYYIEILNDLTVNEHSDVFSELMRHKDAPFDAYLLGHEVISIMIQKALDAEVALAEDWRTFIINIAGDPRLFSSPDYRRWWKVLPLLYSDTMQGWLAGLDLELFLKALKNYADASCDADLQRMYPARAEFLQGLYENKLISLSKLFVGKKPAEYIRQLSSSDATLNGSKPKFSKITDDPNLSVIYLKVGNSHMVEGSHSFKIRIYKELPNKEHFLSYAKPYSKRDLGPGMRDAYQKIHGTSCFEVTHSQGISWQHKTIQEFKKFGVYVDPEWVLTKSDYRDYKDKYGLVVNNTDANTTLTEESKVTAVKSTSTLRQSNNSYFSSILVKELQERPFQTTKNLAVSTKLGENNVMNVLEEDSKFHKSSNGLWSII